MIDQNQIEKTFVIIAQEAVGNFLSSTGNENYSEPSVIIARPNITVPAFPYIVLDTLDIRDTYGTKPREVLEDAELVYYINSTIQLQYTVNGTDPNTRTKALQIAQRLKTYLTLPSIQERICKETCAELQETFPVINASDQVAAQDYLEAAYFTFTISIWDKFQSNRQEDNTGVFDTINLDGALYRNDDDTAPLPIDVDVTST